MDITNDFIKAKQRLRFWKCKYNFNPEIIIDCGSANCEWSDEVKKVFDESNFFLIDHSDTARRAAESKGYKYIDAVLSNIDNEEITIHRVLDHNQTMTVTREMTSIYNNKVPHTQERATTRTLDSLILEHQIPASKIGLIKIDVQGHELNVLDGFKYLLTSKPMLYLEVSCVEYNENQPLVYNIIKYMKKINYHMREIVHQLYHQDDFVQFDAIFMPDPVLWKS